MGRVTIQIRFVSLFMNLSASRFFNYVVAEFPEFFENKRILDCGAGQTDSLRPRVFHTCEHIRNDVTGGRNVNVVKLTHELNYPDSYFDVIILNDYLSYDPYYEASLNRIFGLLKSGGLIVVTDGGTGSTPTPHKSFASVAKRIEFRDHYQTITSIWLKQNLFGTGYFSQFRIYYNSGPEKGVYAWGIKDGGDSQYYPNPYLFNNVFDVTDDARTKCAVVIQGPSTYAKRVYDKWKTLDESVIASTWIGERNKYRFKNVIENDTPKAKGVVNLNMQKASTISGLYLAKEMGFREALKFRSDLLPTNAESLLDLFKEGIYVHAWANHQYGYFTDYYMQGPIDDMIRMWEFDGTAPCAYPEQIITKSILSLGSKISQLRHDLTPENDIYSIKWNLNLSSWVPSFCTWGDHPQ